MLEKLKSIEEKYEAISQELMNPNIASDHKAYQKLMKSHKSMENVVQAFRRYQVVDSEITDTESLLEIETDKSMKEMVEDELKELKEERIKLEEELKVLLLPKDPNDDKSVIIEIRGGAGGNEAALFAGDLFRMYSRFAESKNWKIDILDSHENDVGGYKEIVFSIEGQGTYSQLKYESGVHRVQRIPTTESGGRIHTSTVTVAVLPEAEEVDVDINPNDVRVDLFCSSGPGGQSVNTTQSAVRLTHVPSGIVVSCQDEKSQHKNKDKAMKVLRARLYEKTMEEEAAKIASERKSQVGTGDRSERIRTYNFPQNRITDHRIGLTIHRLDGFLEGDLEEIINALITTNQAERLKESV
ncbi:peptide chain release factor 1 [endosymbiont 'TC1' of Trimyema compressum]|uniref:peptide chain release factor 1 n=1 Tax=endosymbiont 'TC1' of Trimyema compressum TaxID=243899 RepID=UPI0007F0C9FC|nr:peptide chain release factor 1 [endosymbiont 'TC1' of Trimyema compressum]AMP19787.1 peptide chain release factor 1 [endosymbiont 'TC1' of Trimyema compressum]